MFGLWRKLNEVKHGAIKKRENSSFGIQIHICVFHRVINSQGSHLWAPNNVYSLFSFSTSTILEPKYHEKTTFPIISTQKVSPGAY